ncbi:hypothetical protein [Clostridium merdae]|uniref:hypothetical protein n=1 Tax=Clostridium merdae TaxID=1958780 RepID=UPI000A26F481|nr:hypothetical protein [Clostridium merdae]
MAIWQFNFKLIPKVKLFKSDLDNINFNNEKISSWKGFDINESTLVDLSKHLTQTKGWSKDVRLFGLSDENCIELYYQDGSLLDVSGRFSLMSLDVDVLNSVINFAEKNEAVFLSENNEVIETIAEQMIIAIKKSNEFKFVKNPREFLKYKRKRIVLKLEKAEKRTVSLPS